MNKRTLYIIIGLMSVALVGIIGLQAYWISKAMNLSQRHFETHVNNALQLVVRQLEQQEMNQFLVVAAGMEKEGVRVKVFDGSERHETHDSISLQYSTDAVFFSEDNFTGGDLKIRLQTHGPNRQLDTMWVDHGGKRNMHRIPQELSLSGLSVWAEERLESHFRHLEREQSDIEEMFARTLQLVSAPPKNITDRIDKDQLDSMLSQAFHDAGIKLEYQFMVFKDRKKEVIFKTNNAAETSLFNTNHLTQLFPNSPGIFRSLLSVYFPSQRIHTFEGIWELASASVLFTSIILICFALTIRAILRQKKLSEMKNDFINNMTHEFKTPLATISLATDALNAPIVRDQPEKMDYYTRIIKEENQRMNQQVERVLQIARTQIRLKPVELDIHQIIEKAAENIRLHVGQRQGKVELQLSAVNTHLRGDEVHLTNLFTNLLDNANKYSPQVPEITIKSWNEGPMLAISVSDKGLGINKADLEKIFDRFYRVSTGNLHDVKGFGLGLSYVREIVQAHHGEIGVKSKIGGGTTFTIYLPTRS